MSNQRVVVLTDEEAAKIYDILETCCGAEDAARKDFIAYMRQPGPHGHEWRFCGWLGFGGKLYVNSQGVYVDCYSKHKTPLAAFAIKTANERINALLGYPAGITEEQIERGTEAMFDKGALLSFMEDGVATFGEWVDVPVEEQARIQAKFEAGLRAALFPGEDER